MLRQNLVGHPRLAMVTCVRNEEKMLPAHLAFHRAIGVERAYVYLDRCTDNTARILESIPWVSAITLDPDETARFSYNADLQRTCMDHALQLARTDGMDWLFMVDVDEFPIAENRAVLRRRNQTAIQRCDLIPMLARTPKSTDVVTFRVLELMPMDLDPARPFWQQQYFLERKTHGRHALDPADGELKKWCGNVGHSVGKCIVRTSADVQAYDSHFWTRNQGKTYPEYPARTKLKQKTMGHLLHYLITSYQHWCEKYRKLSHEPACWREGASVRFPKQCWKEAASRMSVDDARHYYRSWVALSEDELNKLVRERIARKESILHRVLEELDALDGNDVVIPDANGRCRERTLSLPQSFWTDPAAVGIQRSETKVQCRIADIREEFLEGFGRIELSSRGRYRRAAQSSQLRLQISPDDYVMTIHSHPMSPSVRSIRVKIDGRPVPRSASRIGKHQLALKLSRDDFNAGETHTVTFDYPDVPPRRRGNADARAAISEVSFERLVRQTAAVA